MQRSINRAPPALQLGDQCLHMSCIIDVQFEHVSRLRQPLRRPLCQPDGPSEPGQDDLGALFLSDTRRVPCDGIVSQDPGDDEAFALE